MRVLLVQKEGGIFGAENYHLKIIPGLLAKGVVVEFLRLYTDYQGGIGGEFVDRLKAMNVTVHQINIGKYPTLRVLKKIHKVSKSSQYDLIHTHLIHADFHVVLARTLFGGRYKLVSTKHGYDNSFTSKFGFDSSKQRKTPYFLISRWAERRMQASFTISKGLHNFFIETGLASANKMKLIYYGFDMPVNYEFKGDASYRRALKQIIIAGRLVAFKGHKFLLEAMPKLIDRYGDELLLLIAGTGMEEEALRDQVNELGIASHVEFLGYSKEVGAYMANSDVVVIPSISEGFGVVFLEAFSAKTPVVSWDVPAGNELMEHQKSGFHAKPYEVSDLAQMIMNAIDHDQSELVERAYERLKSDFSLERMVNETISFYQKVISDG